MKKRLPAEAGIPGKGRFARGLPRGFADLPKAAKGRADGAAIGGIGSAGCFSAKSMKNFFAGRGKTP